MTTRSPIPYINPRIPSVRLPSYQGQRYQKMVPDTLDWAERSALALLGLTNTTDPGADHEIYWAALLGNPPCMFHSWNDVCWCKYLDAVALLRLASGSTENLDVEHKWLEVVLHMQGPDGLLYAPKAGRPWWPSQCYGPQPPGDHYTVLFNDGRLLRALSIYYSLTSDQVWLDAGRRLADGLDALAIHDGDTACFPWIQYGPNGQYNSADPATVTHNFASWFGSIVQGLANCYTATGYEPAIRLSGEIARWVITRSNHFDSEGRFLPEQPGAKNSHFHGHTMSLIYILDYALATGDAAALDFVRKSFEYAKGQSVANTIVGYFPEWLSGGCAETCEIADMITLAIGLSGAGVGDYWDDADRWIRNQFAENQLLDTAWVDEAVAGASAMPAGAFETTTEVSQRIIGCFAAGATVNDHVWPGYGVTQACCNGNAARTTYQIWNSILGYQDGVLRVNLLMNRASKWADVLSHVPYVGRADIGVKASVDLRIRLPEWVQPEQAVCHRNGSLVSLSFDGRYACVGKAEQGEVVTIEFPISERTEVLGIAGNTYTIVRKGNDVVSISPQGAYGPFYQREHYRQNQAQWKTVERYVSDQVARW